MQNKEIHYSDSKIGKKGAKKRMEGSLNGFHWTQLKTKAGKSQITGSSSFHINNAKILYFRVSSMNFLRPGLEAFGRDTGTRDSPTALKVCWSINRTYCYNQQKIHKQGIHVQCLILLANTDGPPRRLNANAGQPFNPWHGRAWARLAGAGAVRVRDCEFMMYVRVWVLSVETSLFSHEKHNQK